MKPITHFHRKAYTIDSEYGRIEFSEWCKLECKRMDKGRKNFENKIEENERGEIRILRFKR